MNTSNEMTIFIMFTKQKDGDYKNCSI